jgi:uncharacterized protein (DUF1778 family)
MSGNEVSNMTTAVLTESKTDRMHFRLPHDIKERVEKAAAVSGQTLTDFAVSVLANCASEVLERHETRTLSARDRDIFLAMLDAEEEPNQALKNAAKAYKQRFAK